MAEVLTVDNKCHCSSNAQDADLDVTMPINGSGQEPCSRTENTDAVPVEDHHSNSNTLETIENDHSNSLTMECHHDNSVSTTEEQFLENKKASVAEYVHSVVPTSIHVSTLGSLPQINKSLLQFSSITGALIPQ
jgi:hypothetical protein